MSELLDSKLNHKRKMSVARSARLRKKRRDLRTLGQLHQLPLELQQSYNDSLHATKARKRSSSVGDATLKLRSAAIDKLTGEDMLHQSYYYFKQHIDQWNELKQAMTKHEPKLPKRPHLDEKQTGSINRMRRTLCIREEGKELVSIDSTKPEHYPNGWHAWSGCVA